MKSREPVSLLWEIAQAQRTPLTDQEGRRGIILWEVDDLLDRIDQVIGYDEMGG